MRQHQRGWQANVLHRGIAEFERGLIRKRCEEGIERAKANGKQFGRPTALDHGQRRRVAERYAAGETMAELAREYDCGEATIWRALQGAPGSGLQVADDLGRHFDSDV